MRTFFGVLFAVAAFAAIAGLPWLYWEGARLGMQEQAPASVAWHFTPSYSSGVWWFMGLTGLFWMPATFIFGFSVFWKLLKVALSPPQEGDPRIEAAQKIDCNKAVVLAIQQYKDNSPVTQRCPACGGLIRVKKMASDTGITHSLVITNCSCSKCVGKFELLRNAV